MPLWLTPWLMRLLGALVALGAAFGAGWTVNGWRLDSTVASLKMEMLEDRRAAEAALNVALSEARLREQALYAERERLEQNHEERIRTLDRRLAAARSDGERLRDAAAAAARRSAEASPASCPANDSAAALAELLGEADRLAEEFAGEAERLADQLRGLQEYVEGVVQPEKSTNPTTESR